MTVFESLVALTNYPIPVNSIERFMTVRGLTGSLTFSQSLAESQSYRLVMADIYKWLATSFNLGEQSASISMDAETKKTFLSLANSIYSEYGDSAYSGKGKLGYIGDQFNN